MDAAFFGMGEISEEVKRYTFTATLNDNGTWRELDATENTSTGASKRGGRVGVVGSSDTFIGRANQKSVQFGIGKDNQTGAVGVVGFKFNTNDVKKPIRDYLISCGWKKAAGYGSGGVGNKLLEQMMGTKRNRVIVRIICAAFLLFACIITVGFMQNMIFAKGDLQRWRDGSAAVTASEMTGETLVLNHSNDSVRGDRAYKKYTVRYTYTAEFEAWGKVFSFDYEGSNSGETDQNAEKPPAAAYDFPKQGDTVNVIYDPDKDGSYCIGSKEEWQRKGELSPGNLIVPCVMFIVAAGLIAVDVVSAKKRRIA